MESSSACIVGKRNTIRRMSVCYQKAKAVLNIRKCEIIEGNLPRRQARLVLAWAELHQDELLADWRLAINGEHPAQIEPLK